MLLKPNRGRMLVSHITPDEHKTSWGLFLQSDPNDSNVIEGVVARVGEPELNTDGSSVPFSAGVGQKVLFNKFGGVELKYGDEKFILIKDSDILAVVEDTQSPLQ